MTRARTPRPRAAAAALAAAASMLALAACAAPAGEAATGADDAASLLPAAEGVTEYPLTIETWAGETTVEERPERIAVIGFSTNLDFLEILDVTPVYTITEESEWAWRDPEWLASIETTDTATRRDPTNFEGIAATEPDLIVALNYLFEQADFDRLSAIAPVLEYEEQLGDQADWRAGQQLVGDVLDLGGAATAAIEEADAAIAATAEAHPEFAGRTATIATDYGAQYDFEYYTPTGGTAEGVMLDLGFAPNPLAADFVDDPVISNENLARLDGDVLVVIYADEATREAREAQPLFQAIPAVADGRLSSLASPSETSTQLVTADGETVENATWVLRRGASALSLPWAVDVIADEWLAGIELP
jgi:iron complex transport system substrate-binding protein